MLGRWTAVGMAVTLAVLGALTTRYVKGRDARWAGVSPISSHERSFLYMMAGHHEVGLRLAELAAERSAAQELRALGRLMAAQHRSEIDLMRDWWRGWFGGKIPALSDQDRNPMHGMPAPEQLDELERLAGRDFERRFVALMVPHHEGAIRMSDHARKNARDPRIRLFADGIRHSQQGQIERMNQYG